jgi:hypothetical protein
LQAGQVTVHGHGLTRQPDNAPHLVRFAHDVVPGDGHGPPVWLQKRAWAVAERTLTAAKGAAFARPALVNGAAGVVVAPMRRPVAVMAFTIAGGKIVEIDILADRTRLERLSVPAPY